MDAGAELRTLLGNIYRADHLGSGDLEAARAALHDAAGGPLGSEMRDLAAHLRTVDTARMGKDYATRKQLEYLEAALTEE